LRDIVHRFRQADGSVSREYAGTGIGLALVKEIAALHGGVVSVRSQYGEGSSFEVAIPLGNTHLSPASVIEFREEEAVPLPSLRAIVVEEETADHQSVEEWDRHADATVDPERSTILYADDNSDLRAYVRHLLVDKHNVFLAVDGHDGLEKAQRLHPDLILSDQMMPRMSGRGLLAAIRADA